MQFFLHHMCNSRNSLEGGQEVNSSTAQSGASTYLVKNNRIPIFFNFQIANTLTIKDGLIDKWYYSDLMGQILTRSAEKHDEWSDLIKYDGKNEQT